MKLRTVMSGGQTGADLTALVCGKAAGFTTGGWAPRGFKTEAGINKELGSVYGLKETPGNDYKTRTHWNVRDSDVTVWFGNLNSPGYFCTRNATFAWHKPFIENPSPEQMRTIASTWEIINFAGNRESTNPNVVGMVEDFFKVIHGL